MILVTGSTGLLGSAVMDVLGANAHGLTRADLDLTQTQAIRPFIRRLAPAAIINCAAYTDVDGAEANEDAATAVNGLAVGELASAAEDVGVRFLTVSTDYVFDGSKARPYVESDPPAPLNAYGRSKLDGERRALAEHENTCVVRSSWLLSGSHASFLLTMLRVLPMGGVTVVDDQVGRPTMARDLASAMVDLVRADIVGVVHVTNAEEMSWYELSQRIARVAGIDPTNVTRCSTADFPSVAKRPRYSVLGTERTSEPGMVSLPAITDSLEREIRIAGEDKASGQSADAG